MSSSTSSLPANSLPPMIILNPRKKIQACQVSFQNLAVVKDANVLLEGQLVPYHTVEQPPEPIPKFPISMSWQPNTVCFSLKDDPVVAGFWIWNRSERPIYFHCCGLWNDEARYGASWRCYPRTRFWLPPGLRIRMYVRAAPREKSPIPDATAYMQIAAGHLRDNVTAYFAIPIHVKFLKYIHVAESE